MTTPEPRELVPLPPPPPGLARLLHRTGGRDALRDALLAALAEVRDPSGSTLGSRLDVAGDPTLSTLAELWARVADSVDSYTELAAGERYLGTAQDWTDLRRTVDLLGYRPAQRAAAQGWIRVTSDTGVAPLVPAGTRVQAPGTPQRAAQTYEVAADTALRADWAGLTVTGVPVPAVPPGAALRFLADPGLAPPDRVLLVAETPAVWVPPPSVWNSWLLWIVSLLLSVSSSRKVVATVAVRGRADDLGAFLITTDRPLAPLLPATSGTVYAAYRVRATLDLAHRLEQISYVDGGVAAVATPDYGTEPPAVAATTLLVVDASAASAGMNIVVSNHWGAAVTTVKAVQRLDWSVAPGTKRQVGMITLAAPLDFPLISTDVEIALVDDRVVAQHHELPPLHAGETRCRAHPRPVEVPPRIAVQTVAAWELTTCSRDAADTGTDTGGILLALGAALTADADAAPATANLAPIRHGATRSEPLTLDHGTAIIAGPVTGDVDATGAVSDSLAVRVDGVAFDEVAALYGRGPDEPVYTSKLAADGRLVLTFGDGVRGALPRGEVTATWRVGGGLAGELDGASIDTLLGSVPGVRKVAGVGPTTGAADQEDPLRMRRGAAARIRALDRAVSLTDLADLALTLPGTSHTAAWRGAGPSGCPCGGTGLHVAAVRLSASGVRAPLPAELTALAGYLDARRDRTVPLCVCAGVVSPLAVTLGVVAEPRRDPTVVRAALQAALTDPGGALAAVPRDLGVPIDESDVIAVAQAVTGVVGLEGLTVDHGVTVPSAGDLALGRIPAARYELLYVAVATANEVSGP